MGCGCEGGQLSDSGEEEGIVQESGVIGAGEPVAICAPHSGLSLGMVMSAK